VKICVVVARYSLSGVPLTQIRFARSLAARGHDVDLVFGHIGSRDDIGDLGTAKLVEFGRRTARGMLLPFCRYLRRVQPDIVFSSQDNLNGFVLLAAILTRSNTRISVSSRVHPVYTYSNRPLTRKWLFKQAMRIVMWRANVLTCVSQGMVAQYRKIFPKGRHVCVYNMVDDGPSRARIVEPIAHPWFVEKTAPIVVSAGRLSPIKGYPALILAFARLVHGGRDVRLVIFGEGISRVELEAQIGELGIADRVSLPGNVDNPLRYFAHADVFALTSISEGLGNVLIEAMMCGCSLVATDCPSGPAEILGFGKYGKVVPLGDVPALADAIAMQLDHPTPPTLLAEGLQRFTETAVLARHFDLLGLAGHEGTVT
jgi:glycosyltransferase involved in cell wall biosynthesis